MNGDAERRPLAAGQWRREAVLLDEPLHGLLAIFTEPRPHGSFQE